MTPSVGIICIVSQVNAKKEEEKLEPGEQFESFNKVPLYLHLYSGKVNIASVQIFRKIIELLPRQCYIFLILLK